MNYPGGKNGAGVYQKIINQMPPHDVYIEPFLGSGAIMRTKKPAAIANIGVDRSTSAIAAFDEPPGCIAHCGDGISFLHHGYKFTGRELVYCDPPYVRSSRRSARPIYEHEMTDAHHYKLLSILHRLPCLVMVSGYYSKIYAKDLADWRLVTFEAMTRRGPAIEHLWMNYPEPVALHDYRYLGDDFRERERIKRKVKRWHKKFSDLPKLEQCGILSSLLTVRDTATPETTIADSETRKEQP